MLLPCYLDPAHSEAHQHNELACLLADGECRIHSGRVSTGLSILGQAYAEHWLTHEPPTAESNVNGCYLKSSNTLLFIAKALSADECEAITQHTNTAYTEILTLAQTQGYTHPIRFWNYLPRINQGTGDEELYKQFCLGRFQAFDALHIKACDYPAASALGHHGQGATIYGFFSTHAAQHIENPVQASAYHYPRQYGPKSPSFARATLFNNSLFISGTASVIGSDTVGEGDLQHQLEVTVQNIERILAQVPKSTLHSIKVYIRHAIDYETTRAFLEAQWPDVAALYTHADICRANLLVEIEGVATLAA